MFSQGIFLFIYQVAECMLLEVLKVGRFLLLVAKICTKMDIPLVSKVSNGNCYKKGILNLAKDLIFCKKLGFRNSL